MECNILPMLPSIYLDTGENHGKYTERPVILLPPAASTNWLPVDSGHRQCEHKIKYQLSIHYVFHLSWTQFAGHQLMYHTLCQSKKPLGNHTERATSTRRLKENQGMQRKTEITRYCSSWATRKGPRCSSPSWLVVCSVRCRRGCFCCCRCCCWLPPPPLLSSPDCSLPRCCHVVRRS